MSKSKKATKFPAPGRINTTTINTKGKPLRVVALADLHTGGNVGLANLDSPDTPKGGPGAKVREGLFEAWREATRGPWAEPDILIVDGDALEGLNYKRSGYGVWCSDIREQASHAADLLKMWKAKTHFIIWGSGYHVEAGHTRVMAEEWIARELGAPEYPNQEGVPEQRRLHSGWHWYLHIDGVTFHVSHKISVSRVFAYQTTPTARQMLQAKLNDQLRHMSDEYKIKVVLRAHAHYYNMVDFSGSTGIVLPCWKGRDDFMLERGPLDIAPDIGFVGFTVKDGTYKPSKQLWSFDAIQTAPLTTVRVR